MSLVWLVSIARETSRTRQSDLTYQALAMVLCVPHICLSYPQFGTFREEGRYSLVPAPFSFTPLSHLTLRLLLNEIRPHIHTPSSSQLVFDTFP